VETVMALLDKLGKGIMLMHDFQKHTGEALRRSYLIEIRRPCNTYPDEIRIAQ
jgi:hypothetical protein